MHLQISFKQLQQLQLPQPQQQRPQLQQQQLLYSTRLLCALTEVTIRSCSLS
jgi:hypothetical protein